MPRNLLDDVIQKHRVESLVRETAWMIELAARRADIAAHARVDVDALRTKLAI